MGGTARKKGKSRTRKGEGRTSRPHVRSTTRRVARAVPSASSETSVTVSEARGTFADMVNQVAYAAVRVVLSRRGRRVAALVPLEDLELIEKLEDRIDLEAAREALKEPGSIPWEKVKADLGL